jgi:hypothetical protein
MNHVKTLFCLLSIVGAMSGPITTFAESQAISVHVDDVPVTFDVKPMIKDGRTLVPFRQISEALNVDVDWDAESQKVHGTTGDHSSIVLQIGNKTAMVDGRSTSLDVPPMIIGGRTLIPLRFFSESLHAKVAWDENKQEISIVSPPKDMKVVGFYANGKKDEKGDIRAWPDLFRREFPETSVGNTDIISELALAWYAFNDKGDLVTQNELGWNRPDGWDQVLTASKKYQMTDEMAVLVSDPSIAKSIISTPEIRNTAIQNLIREAKNMYGGINLDIEGLGVGGPSTDVEDTRQKFTAFVQQLSEQTKLNHLRLTLTLPPINSSYQGYDYEKLGQLADEIIIMAYDFSSKEGSEPNDDVMKAVDLAQKEVPSDKLLLGISADSETKDSIQSKIGIAKRSNIKGIALWKVGLLTDPMWDVLKSSIHAEK